MSKIARTRHQPADSRRPSQCRGAVYFRVKRIVRFMTVTLFLSCSLASRATAQVSASLSGTVTDQSGAAVAGATVTARNLDSGILRITSTDVAGRYQLVALAVGAYEVQVTKDGFAAGICNGVRLSVGQEATVDVGLRVGAVSEELKVTADAPVVNLTTQDISGLVGERQVKDLPLNGRSYDLLLALNPGVVNFTSEKTGGIGVSNSTTGNNFAVSGNRPQQNLFLMNGVEFTGAAENNMQPGGASGELLGVDAVREFNVLRLRDSYGAEYGKHPGGQVIIVTDSGTNQLHGSVYEFLRNNALDAPNYFDQGSAPPFQRNQFGASLGGPIQKDKTFLVGNYEGLRQHLHQTSAAFVPDAAFSSVGRGQCPAPIEPVAGGACRRAGLQRDRAGLQQSSADHPRGLRHLRPLFHFHTQQTR